MTLTEEQIIKGNELIMRFFGLEPNENGWYNGWEMFQAGLPFSHGAGGNGTYDPPFHKRWDWQMMVVERIENLRVGDFYPTRVLIDYNYCSIDIPDAYWWEPPCPCESKIEATWLAVTNFLEWYYENKN